MKIRGDHTISSEILHSILGRFFLPSLSSWVESTAKVIRWLPCRRITESWGPWWEQDSAQSLDRVTPPGVGTGAGWELAPTMVQSISKFLESRDVASSPPRLPGGSEVLFCPRDFSGKGHAFHVAWTGVWLTGRTIATLWAPFLGLRKETQNQIMLNILYLACLA